MHQLGFQLNQLEHVTAYIYYYGQRVEEVIQGYQQVYPSPQIPDLSLKGAQIIIPEPIDPVQIIVHQSCTKWIWWLSAQRFYPLQHYINVRHLFQSEYARTKLTLLGLSGIMLTDYVRNVFIANSKTNIRKNNWIAFNAAKSSFAAIQLLRQHIPATLIPIHGMQTDQVQQVLSLCRMYIDFGWHPGRDRLPREAVMNGCLIVTGRDGAALNEVDIPIPHEYKIELRNLRKNATKITKYLSEYDKRFTHFDSYRNSVLDQERIFKQEIFNLIKFAHQDPGSCKFTIGNYLDAFLLEHERQQRVWQQGANEEACSLFEKLMRPITAQTDVS